MFLQANVLSAIIGSHLVAVQENYGHSLQSDNATMFSSETYTENYRNEYNYFASEYDDESKSGIIRNDSEYNVDYDIYQRCHMIDVTTNFSYWNLTCDTPLEYGLALYGYCMPFLLITTIISNSLIVLVLRKKNMITPTNFVLMSMAICDMLTVIFPAPGFWYMYLFGNHYKPHPVLICIIYRIFSEILPSIMHAASIWLTLALAIQRYIYVCHAPMARTWCTMPRIKRFTVYIVILAILHQSTRFFDLTFEPLIIEWNGVKREVCHIEIAAWVLYINENLYFTIFFSFRVLFVHLLPCVILVTLNILLFRAMRLAQERRKLLFHENRKKECKKLRDTNCTTLMLIVVVSVFLIVEIPVAVVTIIHIVQSSLDITLLEYRIANILVAVTNFFLVVTYPINFGIYCGMSRQFRETFKEIFFGRCLNKKDQSKYSMVNGPRTNCTQTNDTVL